MLVVSNRSVKCFFPVLVLYSRGVADTAVRGLNVYEATSARARPGCTQCAARSARGDPADRGQDEVDGRRLRSDRGGDHHASHPAGHAYLRAIAERYDQ